MKVLFTVISVTCLDIPEINVSVSMVIQNGIAFMVSQSLNHEPQIHLFLERVLMLLLPVDQVLAQFLVIPTCPLQKLNVNN